MNIFVTGHTGFKGKWLTNILLLKGHKVTGYALENSNKIPLLRTENFESLIGDVRDYPKLKEAMLQTRPDIVFHLAAQPLVRESYKNPLETFETNIMGTANVLESLRKCPSVKSFVNVTTDKVYKEQQGACSENFELCGRDPYSNSKSCSELVTYSYKNSFFDFENASALSTARAGNVIGGGDNSKYRIIPDCVRAVIAKQTIIVRNPCSVRPYQHILDCLSGYILLAEKQLENPELAGAYNFGPDENSCVSTGALADLFCDAWGGDASWTIENAPNTPYESNYLWLNSDKAKNILGWQPKYGIKIAVEKTVEYEKCKNQEEKAECMRKQISCYDGI